MEMWLKQSTVALFAASLLGVVVSAQFSVLLDQDQDQDQEHVPVGSSLTLKCCLNISQYQKLRVFWYFRSFGLLRNYSQNLSMMIIQPKNNSKEDRFEETYVISNVAHNNSGWYYCQVTVEIPRYETIVSKETQVNVTSKNLVENTSYPSLVMSTTAVSPPRDALVMSWWMWMTVGVSASVLLLLLLICVLQKRRHDRSRDDDPIYINTRPIINKQPSPRPSADNLKMGSASQQLRTPSPGRRYEESNRRPRH